MHIDFENIESKLRAAVESKEYKNLIKKLSNADRIYLLGNGGLHFVAGHMATDLSRLIANKVAYSFDTVGFITSNANDHGFENIFVRWLETVTCADNPEKCIVIGMSCSGNSTNVVSALDWAEKEGFQTFMLSGQKSKKLSTKIDELNFNCDFFHTVEVLCMMLFYDVIHAVGSTCPSINEEKKRLVNSPLRG